MMVVETGDTIMAHSRCSHAKGKTPPFSTHDLPQISAARRPNQAPRIGCHVQRPKLVLRIFTCNSIHLLGNCKTAGASHVTSRAKWARTNVVDIIRWGSRRCFELAHISCRGSQCSLAATSNRPSTHHVPIQRPRSPHFSPESALPILPPYPHSLLYLHLSSCRRTSSLLALAVSNARGSRTVLRIANDVDSVRLERCSHHLLGWRQCHSP
jgi:hypothetical protein